MHSKNHHPRRLHDLGAIADRIMLDKGLAPDFSAEAKREAGLLEDGLGRREKDGDVQDLCDLPWSSIDNDDSRDLDQLEVVFSSGRDFKLLVAIADVDFYVKRDSAIDRAAAYNTTSVYTGVKNYPMLPTRLSYDLSSLMEGKTRMAMVVETMISASGAIREGRIYRARVYNQAKLNYPAIAAWL